MTLQANKPDSLEEFVDKQKYRSVALWQKPANQEEEAGFWARLATCFAVSLPEEAVEHKMAALLAETKLKINADPLYNVLADFTYIMDHTFRATGVRRSLSQIQAEALDILLQTVSKDQKTVSKEFFYTLLKERAHGYRNLPADFDTQLDKITAECQAENKKKSPEERINQVFAAYLGSINQTEAMWLHNNRPQAELGAKLDLLYDAVAAKEKLAAKDTEVTNRLIKIAADCQMPVDAVEKHLDLRLLRWQICREKAREFLKKIAGTS